MADTDIRCHRACVYSSCSVRLRVRRSCDTDCRTPLMRAWDSVTAWERGERQSVIGAKVVLFESNLSQGPYWRSHTELYGHLWMLTHARGRTAALCLHVRACVRAWTTADRSMYRRRRRRRTSTQDTAYAKLYATYRCCQCAQLRCHGDGRLCTGALPWFYIGCYRSWVPKHFFAVAAAATS